MAYNTSNIQKKGLYDLIPQSRNEIDVEATRRKEFAREYPRLSFTIEMIRRLSVVERNLEAQLTSA